MRIDEDYAQRTNPISSIKAILEAYPLSIGIFRELIQNSDDAGATVQTFVLDRRTHPAQTLYHEGLKPTQGPSLLAFNNAILQDRDWEGLSSMHDSSKTDDLSKIGKYGIGFRSVFNITDCPQILSDKKLAIFDPLSAFLACEGKRLDLAQVWSNFGDTVAPFSHFTRAYVLGSSFDGTVIRCPLRTQPSELSKNVVTADIILQLFDEFIKQDVDMSLLFLKNVKTLEILEIEPNGNHHILAHISSSKSAPMATTASHSHFYKTILTTSMSSSPTQIKEWLLVHSDFPQSEVANIFLQRPGYDLDTVANSLKEAKFRPEIALALDLTRFPNSAVAETDGHLFTFLPLPIPTGLPVHLHALFAIDSSRRYLKRAETGLLKGSRDDTVVQWNSILFQTFIPRTWRILLETVVEHYKSIMPDIFNIWPPEIPSTELRAYASSLSQNLFHEVLSHKSPVWPIYSPEAQSAMSIIYTSLDNVILARSAVTSSVLKALTRGGLALTHPRSHISSLAEQAQARDDGKDLSILTPEVANANLQNSVQLVEDSSDLDKGHLLEYLLSTKNIENIVGLPLIPLGGARRIALRPSGDDSTYTLLTRQEFDVFGPCDDQCIPLHLLPLSISPLFRDESSLSKVNARLLSVPAILSYLSQYPNRLGLTLSMSRKDPKASKWLSKFWVWLNTFTHKDELFQQMCGLSGGNGLWVLPSTNGLRQLVMKTSEDGLRQVPVPLFLLKGQHPLYTQPLLKLGLPFLDTDVDVQAGRVLESFGLCVSIQEVGQVLDALAENLSSEPPSGSQCDTILKFFAGRLEPSVREDRSATLKKLPIFPVLSFGPGSNDRDELVDVKVVTSWSCIPPGFAIRSVSRHSKFIPTMDGILFVGLEGVAPELAKLVEPQDSSLNSSAIPLSLSEHQLLELTATHLASQPLPTQLALLSFVCNFRSRIPPYIFDTIACTPFVMAEDGTLRTPVEMIDEDGAVSVLYDTKADERDQTKFPSKTSLLQKKVVKCLKELDLIQSELTIEILRERIQYISISSHYDGSQTDRHIPHLAMRLLKLICSSRWSQSNDALEVKQMNIDLNLRWLPTNQGIRNPMECRPGKGFNTTPAHSSLLFDLVLGELELADYAVGGTKETLPAAFIEKFGWDQPISTRVLIQQLDEVLKVSTGDHQYPSYEATVEIMKELSHRASVLDHATLGGDDDLLRSVTRDRKWIPTTSNTLEVPTDVVFDIEPVSLKAGFLQINSGGNENLKKFLRTLGCTERPSVNAIITKLHALQKDVTGINTADMAISLLLAVPPSISSLEKSKLLIPDTTSHLRPFATVLFNDIGENSQLLPISTSGSIEGDGRQFIAHHYVTEQLAHKLGLSRLGLQPEYAELHDLGPNLGQDPITTVRQGLKDYTSQQFLPEFLANAADAGATTFEVMLNHSMLVSAGNNGQRRDVLAPRKLISQNMEYLYDLPSIVIHNNALFSEQDFTGICKTSIGGKKERSDTIGEFGLGALSMYHFTDVVTIISGAHILFLDPSKKHLEISDSAAMKMSLRNVQRFYSDHLSVVHGLFGFDMSSDRYEGTLFILPLRSSDGAYARGTSPEFIVSEFWSAERVLSGLLQPFRSSASSCLLFTKLETLRCYERRKEGEIQDIWAVTATRTAILDEEPNFSLTSVNIYNQDVLCSSWTIAKSVLTQTQVPERLHTLTSPRRPFAGLAARCDRASPENPSFQFFSTLPLPATTTLPMHVMASFQLSSDRRQIRCDYNNLQSEFNIWLLNDVIPSLYLQFMEYLLSSGDLWYRQRWPTSEDDSTSKRVVDGFYNCLKVSPRRVFGSRYLPTHPLTSREAVLSGAEPVIIHRALELLHSPCLTEIPSAAHKYAVKAGIAKVDAAFIRAEILLNPDAITSEPDPQVLTDIIHYLTKDIDFESADRLFGLPILPLEDGSFGTLDSRLATEAYYIWKPKDRSRGHHFPPGRFVHPRVPTRDLNELMKLQPELNVVKLDATAIKGFLDSQFLSAPDSQAPWIYHFWHSWPEYQHHGLKEEEILSYSLVPTTRADTFVSLDDCKGGLVLLTKGASQEDNQLRTCLHSLGLHVVRCDGEPSPFALSTIFQSQEYPSLTLESVLRALGQSRQPMSQLFEGVNQESQKVFSRWARHSITRQIEDSAISLARELPIWPSECQGAPRELRPATAMQLLPNNMPLDIAAPYMDCIVSDRSGLQYLQCAAMTFEDVRAHLNLPSLMDEQGIESYKRFFSRWIEQLPLRHTGSVPVPAQDMTIQDSELLYARQPFFVAVFPPDTPKFLHPEFEEFSPLLLSCGLQQENDLDVAMFFECVVGLNPNAEGSLERATELFRAFNEILPLRVGPEDADMLVQLDDYPFIPRREEGQRRLPGQGDEEEGLLIPDNVRHLDRIVDPSELVRKEFEAIAWSQKATFEVQPLPRLIMVHGKLGEPSFSEVIAHLRYLVALHSQIIRPSQRRILVHDLGATYQYLNTKIDALQQNETYSTSIITQLQTEPLFLNVDEPSNGNWRFDTADSLVFDTRDSEASGNVQIHYVREFLLPFEDLLSAAGVQRVHHPEYTSQHDPTSFESTKLRMICSGFNELRQRNKLIDCKFEFPNDSPNDAPLVAHRSFLAVVSDNFMDMFCGDMKEAGPADPDNLMPVKMHDHSRECVQTVLDYIYTGEIIFEDPTLDLYLGALALSNYWDLPELHDRIQADICSLYISPENLDLIKHAAIQHNAQSLVIICEEFETRNPVYIAKIMGGSGSIVP
ncbi:hypothetical protein CPB83DRAFT_863634 [Crepidotus variabilis]|uniref:BTB domain-containing protein n=1 Tax=Crepidotus variabilis TaxID=179855 RepID=A0A9P6JJ85_9AGAR|nr:hypothetical protein CPB83DRAFT_863634 [Crepidotus variabilis]